MTNSKKEKKLDTAATLVRNLVEKIRASEEHPPSSEDITSPVIAFSREGMGGLHLSGIEANMYRSCLDALREVHGPNSDIAPLSLNAIKDLLQIALLRALGAPQNPREIGRTSAHVRRLDSAIHELRSALLAEQTEWDVTTHVQNLTLTQSQSALGRVTFKRCNNSVAKGLSRFLGDFTPPPGQCTEAQIAAEQTVREESRREMENFFEGRVIATVRVRAMDVDAARQFGFDEIRRTIDVLNFFASRLIRLHKDEYAYVSPLAIPEIERWIVHQAAPEDDGGQWSFMVPWRNRSLKMPSTSSRRARKIGLARASELLAAQPRSELDQRIVTAMMWAGRAEVESRRDQSFLLYAIALEALLTKPQAKAGVTERLRFRMAHLLGPKSEVRKRVFATIGTLYDLRSNIVHSGMASSLSQEDVEQMRFCVRCALTVVLTESTFVQMNRADEFERWFDDRLFEGGPRRTKRPTVVERPR